MSPNTPARENNKLERLEGELKTQEQLLIGYEQENRRLCQEMSSLKVTFNHVLVFLALNTAFYKTSLSIW